MPSKKSPSELTLRYGNGPTPFGNAWLAWSESGIARLAFAPASTRKAWLAAAAAAWPEATWVEDNAGAEKRLKRCFKDPDAELEKGVILRGSDFQHLVWHALLAIPAGQTTTYGELAAAIGRPGAARAVGTAVGANPIAWLVPCHRVLPASGGIGGYAWGPDIKRQMLTSEAGAKRR
jgi:AraC family transcriptional regulator, regulatory protein of adaptative response / methylated-DNA-[protein]-cysteine methyltransferase